MGTGEGASNNVNNTNNSNNTNNWNNNTGLCGNETWDQGEDCDGSDLHGETCVSLGYAGSGLVCDANCQFDTSNCDPLVTCGNGTIDSGEECDGIDLGGHSCTTLGYHGTGLACDTTCHLDTSVCEANGRCGDGVMDAAHEECDGFDLGGRFCGTLGYHGTGLACDDTCHLDTSVCESNGTCGDGVMDAAYEECDLADVGGEDCASLGLGVGPVDCTPECLLDLSDCVDPEVCDDHTDNDGDSLVDCFDTDCAADPWCLNTYSTEFGTTDERVQIGSLQEVTGTNPVTSFSVSYWLKLAGIQHEWAVPMGVSSDDHWHDGFGFYHSSADLIRFWINDYLGPRASTSISLSNNVWYHVVGTYDAALGSDNIKIYLNGVLSGTGDAQVPVSESGRPISIGALYTDDLVGFVDEVGFWPIALSAQNVAAIYNGGSPFNLTYDQGNYDQSSTLSAYYRMGDQDTHPVIIDHAGNHNGTVATGNGDEFVTDVP